MDMDRAREIHSAPRPPGGVARSIGLSVLLLGSLARWAPAQGLLFRHLTSDQGLAGSWVQSITQDSRGFMWFGTSTGLSRYDGYTMQTYRHTDGAARSIADNSVWALVEDRKGILWVGTRAGLSRYDRASDAFTSYMVREEDAAISQRQVRAIAEDSRQNLWVGTTRGLFRFDRPTGTAIPYVLPETGLPEGQSIRAVREDRRKHILIGTHTDGMFDLDPVTGTLRHFAHGRAGATDFPSNDVEAFAEDARGRLWVGTYDAGLILFDPESGRRTIYRHNARVPTSLSMDHIQAIAVDGAGWLWLATENGGLEHFNPVTEEFSHTSTDPNNPTGASSDSYWSLYIDVTRTLWAGTFAGGVDILRSGNEPIRRFSGVVGDKASLSNNSVLGFAQDSAGMIWVATDGGGINRLDPKTGKFTRYTSKTSNLNKDAVLAAAVDRAGKLWLGTWDGGLSELDPRTGRFTAYTSHNTNLKDDHLFSVHVDGKGRIWAGTWQSGLVQFDPVKKSFTEYHFGASGAESQIWIIREMHDGRLLLGTVQNGLLLFDPVSAKMTVYASEKGNPRSLASSIIRAILEESPGIVWVGTTAGLDRLDVRTGAITHYTSSDGLPTDMISGLALDKQGGLWVSTEQGVALFDYRHRSSKKYTAEDGLQSREFTARAYLSTREGALLFGGNRGFNLIRPELLEWNARKPRVVFTGFQLFNKPVAIGAPGSPLTTQISETKEIRLSYAQSVFTIEFAALDFTAPAKNQYAYKLEGFDRDWTYAGTSRSATYTRLAAGTYHFHVRASNNDGVWNDEGASITIVIVPPFWATWWFRTLLALAAIAAIAAIVRSAQERHRGLRAMNARLGLAAEHDRESQQYLERNVLDILGAMQRFSGGDYAVALDVNSDDAIGKLRLGFNSVVADRQRAEEELRQSQKMEAVGRLAGGVAHDFNNLLTVIRGNTELALADIDSKEAVRDELEEIARAAEQATSLTRQLLAFSRKQILQPRTLLLNEMLVDVGRILRRTVGEDIELDIVLGAELGAIRADPGQLEQVVLNLVVNARDAMPRGGKLRIETMNVDAASAREFPQGEDIPYVAIVVTDTGTGMTPEVRGRIFEPFFTTKEQGKGTGLGLSTVYGGVKQSGGFVHVDSELGRGTTFSVFLPRVLHVAEPVLPAKLDSAPDGTATVLVVEDEEALRRLTSRVLMRSGYHVLSAANGAEAIRIALEYDAPIDLLMTDVVMPGMSGRELAERLMPTRPGIRLLYTSGYTEDAIVLHGVSSDEMAFLEKPFTSHSLLRKIHQVLEAAPSSVAAVLG
jgi:signal transduction histidine kinase/ligand-binding sensor domain-containing protein/ActR/RegA family two-component response regulator